MNQTDARDFRHRLIVALDVDTAAEARRVASALGPLVGCFKVGLQLFVAEGPQLVRDLVSDGVEVFLDLKLHDIPNTVASAARNVAALGVSMFTVHCANGRRALAHCASDLDDYCAGRGIRRPRVLGVTVLTSLSDEDVAGLGMKGTASEMVDHLVGEASSAGLTSFVASPLEAARIKKRFPGSFLVTPGIRPSGAPAGDQSRAATPAEAIAAGADALVVGRPILKAAHPPDAARLVLEEIARTVGCAADGPAQSRDTFFTAAL